MLPLFFLESFVWAFLPFRSGIAISPALDELRLANSIINDELFRRPESAKAAGAESTSPEASLNRMLLHVNAAGTTAGRLSQVFGILIPVRVACYVCLAWCVTFFAAARSSGHHRHCNAVGNAARPQDPQRVLRCRSTLLCVSSFNRGKSVQTFCMLLTFGSLWKLCTCPAFFFPYAPTMPISNNSRFLAFPHSIVPGTKPLTLCRSLP